VQDEVNREESEQDEVDGRKEKLVPEVRVKEESSTEKKLRNTEDTTFRVRMT